MLHVLVQWNNERKWDVYPTRCILDPAVGLELLNEGAAAPKRLSGRLVEVQWKPGEKPALGSILGVGKWNGIFSYTFLGVAHYLCNKRRYGILRIPAS